MRRTTSPSSPAGCVLLPARARACSASTPPPVSIKSIEVSIIDRAFAEGWVVPESPQAAPVAASPSSVRVPQVSLRRSNSPVRVTPSSCSNVPDRTRRTASVRDPEFKMEKRVLDRRLDQMRAEGTEFRCNAKVGRQRHRRGAALGFDAIVLAGGSTIPRDLPVPGRDLAGIHVAMEYLTSSNQAVEGTIPGAADHRAGQARDHHRRRRHRRGLSRHRASPGRASRSSSSRSCRVPPRRAPRNPWPLWPLIFRTSAAHEEGGERLFSVATDEFLGDADGNVRALRGREVEMVSATADRRSSRSPGPSSS